jgi:hypothetical protein
MSPAVGAIARHILAVEEAHCRPSADALLRTHFFRTASFDSSSSSGLGLATAKPLRSFYCPITNELMRDPVMCADGHSYERIAIEQWFARAFLTSNNRNNNGGGGSGGPIIIASPLTNEPPASTALTPNHALRASIEEFLALDNVSSVFSSSSSS